MKFSWFSKILAVVMAMLPIAGQAQVTTYISDVFASGVNETYWDLDASTPIKSGTVVYGYKLTGLSGAWVGWVYDVKASDFRNASTKLKGDYDLVSKSYQIEDAQYSHVVSFDYYYKAPSSSSVKGQDRNFFVKYRIDGGDWKVAYTMYGDSETLQEVLEPQRISVTLPEEVSGKKVQISLGIRNNVENDDLFAILIGDVNFGSWSEKASVRIAINPGLPSEDGMMDAVFSNTGLEDVSSCKYQLRLNGKQVLDADLEIATPLAPGSDVDAKLSLSMADMIEGKNILEAWVTEVNGAVPAVVDTTVYGFANVDASQVDKYRPLIEFFTSSTCIFCAGVAKTYQVYLDDLRTKKDLLSVIKYQCPFPNNGDPYAIQGNVNRYGYYGDFFGENFDGIPQSVYSGQTDTKVWGGTTAAVGQLRSKVLSESKQQSLLSIRYDTLILDEETGYLEFTVKLTPIVDMKANLIPIVLEGTTTGNKGSNGETEFHWVTMAYPAGPFGEEVDMQAGDVKTFVYKVDLSETHVEEYTDIEVVCLFQDYATGKIYQTSLYDYDNPPSYDNDEDPDVSNEESSLENSTVIVYPNPAREVVYVSGVEDASVKVFDMQGRLVKELVSVKGDAQIDVSDLMQGTYIVRIVQGDSFITRKMTVVR